MRLVVQRVRNASVTVDGTTVGAIGTGLLVLVGFTHGDGPGQIAWLAQKVTGLRLFPDDADRMNRSVREVGGSVLVVSQFTLYGDARKGRRPSFLDAAPPEAAMALYEAFVDALEETGVPVATGRFGAAMDVQLVNWGPVTLVLDR